MATKYRLEIEVVVEGDTATKTVETAREHYIRRGGVMEAHGKRSRSRAVPSEKFVTGIEAGLMELVEHNPLLEKAGVDVTRESCGVASPSPGPPDPASEDGDEGILPLELDEFEPGLYLCRWPNGDFSIVKADSRREAIVALDEWAGAEPAWLIPMESCMIDFSLNDRAEIDLLEFGEETTDFIWDRCYPELEAVLSGEVLKRRSPGKQNSHAAKKIRRAVQHERERLWNVQGTGILAKTAIGRELQKRLGTVGPVADHYVEEFGNRVLRGEKGTKGKPN